MPKFKKKRYQKGQAYLDIIIAIGIFAILAHALITLVLLSFELVSFTKSRNSAKHIAAEKIEIIRNLPFAQLGTIGGIPSGELPQIEEIDRNGLKYTVKTSIIYIDDQFDGLAPTDTLPTDYKRVRVEVSWPGVGSSKINPVRLFTDISPKGIETTAGGGTLSILVFDAYGQVINQANVHIVATAVNPQVDLNLQTSADGRIILPGAPACVNCYQISVDKDGFSSEKTYSNQEVANPNRPHQTILENQITEISFAIDKVSTLQISSHQDRENNFAPLANQEFRLQGEKTIGTDINDDPVYKFNQNFTTDQNGLITIDNLEWDNYFISLPSESSQTFSGTNPFMPINILPDKTISFSFALSPKTANSLLAIFEDSAQIPIASVSAILKQNNLVVASASSGLASNPDFGQIFIANLQNQLYNLIATASGFQTSETNINISGEKQQVITLNQP